MPEFASVIKEARQGVLYINIPNEIIKKMNLKPFMAARMNAEKGRIIISGFEKTIKVKLKIDKKTLAMLKKIMKMKGFASIDETMSNVIHEFFEKGRKTHIVYLYPEDYLKGECILIEDYEKKRRG